MENYENDIFGFDPENNKLNDDSDKFNYNDINGLGESDYENDDIFNNEIDKIQNNNISYDGTITFDDQDNDDESGSFDGISNITLDEEEEIIEEPKTDEVEETIDELNVAEEEVQEMNNEEQNKQKHKFENKHKHNNNIKISDTPLDELKELTKNKKEKVEITNITDLFDKVNVNVKDASDIFKRNSEMKEKIDTRFEELRKLQGELETNKRAQMEEINKYKKEVFNKLNAKKIEIEKRLNTLKDLQAALEKDKDSFEQYKKNEQDKISAVQKDVQKAYDDRREELNKIEDELRKQKDLLDEEKNQLSLDRIQYESDKNDLANNILKFNELVDSFNQSVNGVRE